MTSIENLIESQRTELLELGFRQRHGFSYEYVSGNRLVELVIGSDDVWTVTSAAMWEMPGSPPADVVRLSPGISLPTFVAVVGSLID